MASKTYKVAGGGTATVTTNSDGSRSISFSNNVGGGYGGSTITGSAGGTSVTRTNSNGTTQTGTISGSGKNTSISWADTPSNGGGGSNNNNNNNNNNPGFTPVNQVDFGGLQFGQGTSDSDQGSRNDILGRYYAGRDNVTADSIRADLMSNQGFANASAADQQNTINKIMNLQNQYRNGGGGGGGNLNGEQKDYPYPQYPQNNSDYSGQFEGIKNYINSLSGDLSGMRDLMEKNNTMFLSKLDAQMTQQKAMEAKFNAEWAKIEGQMDENTKAQKTRLDQMEQKYNENLQKMQDMLTDYYTGTMDALEAKAAGESAAAASDLSAKGLNSAVVANTTAGLDKNYREQFNALMKNNIELGQQLNNDYADFMNQLLNQHNTLDQNQINVLTNGLKMKQQYRQQETDLVNSYIDNVYKPMENHISKLAETYTDRADAAYKNERAVAEYKGMSTAARTRDIMNRLMAMVGDGNLETLSEQDLNLISQIASRSDINSTEEAIAVLLKAAQKSGNSDIINAVSTAQQNGTWNVNPGNTNNPGKTNNPGNTNNPGGNDTEDEGNEGENTETEDNNNGNNNTSNSSKQKYSVILLDKNGKLTALDKLNSILNGGDSTRGKAEEVSYLKQMLLKDYSSLKNYRDTLGKGTDAYNRVNQMLTEYERAEQEISKAYSNLVVNGEGKASPHSSYGGYAKELSSIVDNNKSNTKKISQLNSLKKSVQNDINKYSKYIDLSKYNDLIKQIDNEISLLG